MRLVRIGVAATSVKVGDFTGNLDRLRAVVDEAGARGVHLLVTPELGLSGYSLEDRVLWPDIARRSWEALMSITEDCGALSVFVGLPVIRNALVYNAAAFIHGGEVRGLILKKYLPTYSIFYEGRNWTSWGGGVTEINGVPAGDLVFKTPYGMVSGEVCEDMWTSQSPGDDRALAGAEIICNISGSPFLPCKNDHRRRLVLGAAQDHACVYAYANLLGCDNSRLVFDGGGFIATPDGIVAEGPILSTAPWTLTTGVVDIDDISRVRAENSIWRQHVEQREGPSRVEVIETDGEYRPASVEDYVAQLPESLFVAAARREEHGVDQFLDELLDALVLGLRDYFEKVGVFDRYLLALSGGRDSALCLVLAVRAAKALKNGAEKDRYDEHIATIYLPNEGLSSDATEEASRSLAEEMGVPYKVVSINEEAQIALKKAQEILGDGGEVTALARQNLQARVRGNMMLNWANSANGLLLVTSNLSEAAVGYTTTGGDNQGGYSPILNVPKTIVSRLLDHIMKRDGIQSIQKVLDIPPSAELAENQQDEADLMPYPVLDDLLYLFARRRMALSDCWRVLCHRHKGQDAEQLRAWTAKFGKLFAQNQWKRDQHPVSLKVLDLDLDPKTGFRFPVTQSMESELQELADAIL